MPRGSRRGKRNRRSAGFSGKEESVETSIWSTDGTTRTDEGTVPKNSFTVPGCLESINELSETTLSRVQSLPKLSSPTVIQRYAWPILEPSNRRCNLIAISPTGSGKTFGYGLTLVSRSLVLTPTRELTQQVARQLQLISGIQVIQLHGGRDDKRRQIEALDASDSWNVLVATPGRLLDILETADNSSMLPDDFDTFVLDEADRLAMDGSLQEQVSSILLKTRIPSSRVILVSATYPDSVTPLWKNWVMPLLPTVIVQVNTLQVDTKNESSMSRIPSHIQQVVHVCGDHKRRKKLLRTLESQDGVGIIFFAKIQTLLEMEQFLRQQEGCKNKSIAVCHGQLSQQERDGTLHKSFDWLLATDLAARGIHCERIQFVIQFDFPSNIQQYVHRCGRIRGSSGVAYAFFSRRLRALAADLVDLLEACGQNVDPNLRGLVAVEPPNKKVKEDTTRFEETAEDVLHDDEFGDLSAQRIVLKRNVNVSEASESSTDETA